MREREKEREQGEWRAGEWGMGVRRAGWRQGGEEYVMKAGDK